MLNEVVVRSTEPGFAKVSEPSKTVTTSPPVLLANAVLALAMVEGLVDSWILTLFNTSEPPEEPPTEILYAS